MKLRSCFEGLANGLEPHLVEGSESRQLYEYHRGRIAAIFATQPELPLHQDTVVGFVHGFLICGAYFVADGSIEQESMFPVLGGALLLGQDLPIGTGDIRPGVGFFERAVKVVYDIRPADVMYELVERAFGLAPDVPMTCASLGGFCLGVLYAAPYLTGSDLGPAELIAAACDLADDLLR